MQHIKNGTRPYVLAGRIWDNRSKIDFTERRVGDFNFMGSNGTWYLPCGIYFGSKCGFPKYLTKKPSFIN
jgi:hypothetical protein